MSKCQHCGEEHGETISCLEALGVDDYLTEIHLEERAKRIRQLIDDGGQWEPDGRFIFVGDILYDEDGNRL